MKIKFIPLAILSIALLSANGTVQITHPSELAMELSKNQNLSSSIQEKSNWVTYKNTSEYVIKTQLTLCGTNQKTLLQFENLTSKEINLQIILKPLIPTITEIEFQVRLAPKQVETFACDNKNIQYGVVNESFEIESSKI